MSTMASKWDMVNVACIILLILAEVTSLVGVRMVGAEEYETLDFACDTRKGDMFLFPYCDKHLSAAERIRDLLQRLTPQEKAEQLVNTAPAVPRLGLPAHEWWGEGLHGVAQSPGVNFGGSVPCATSFAQVITSASSFNTTLWYLIGEATSTEARAMHQAGRAALTLWAPNVNIFRDPRWGRGQETPGEDPFVASRYAAHFVRGLQGDEDAGPLRSGVMDIDLQMGTHEDLSRGRKLSTDVSKASGIEIGRSMRGRRRGKASGSSRRSNSNSGPLKASACCKHFTAYDVENWGGMDRTRFDAQVTAQDMADTYQPPFQACVQEGRASSVMCSYNEVNGIPACADHNLLTTVLRKEWEFEGYIASDCGAIWLIYYTHNWTSTPEAAVAAALHAGVDLNCGTFFKDYAASAINASLMTETALDKALTNLYNVGIRLGMLDGDPRKLPFWGHLNASHIDTSAHRQLALESALQGMVLLKNEKNVLPLDKGKVKTVAVVGPHANSSVALLGSYSGVACRIVTMLDGMSAYVRTLHAPGCSDIACSTADGIAAAVAAAQEADVTLLVVGLDDSQEAEVLDRVSLRLPGHQPQLLKEVANANRRGPLILVIVSGGPVDVAEALEDERVSAIIWAGYPGQAGGEALGKILFGEYNPAGRLPMTWYPEAFVDEVSMLDMRMRPEGPSVLPGYPGRTHRFYTGPTLFNFGDGLSYTTFSYSDLEAPTSLRLACNERTQREFDFNKVYLVSTWATVTRVAWNILAWLRRSPPQDDKMGVMELIRISVDVKNNGTRDGHHVVLLFFSPPASTNAPLRSLIAFERVHLRAGQSQRVSFTLEAEEALATAEEDGSFVVKAGVHTLQLGDLTHVFLVEEIECLKQHW
eukprot:TRINITY_DN14972_c0_g1_i1.p1 TRINITY_DN14972_c0_g1~~TRINITY_DN14972_c0_g1_i1.p1  ORF type:complete len:873 (+),score=102.60 TRINITY_DN14972_c0_g1_i1:115-2733(+)